MHAQAPASQTFGFDLIQKYKKVQVPFENLNNLIVLPVTVNGQANYKFILDSGAPTTVITEKQVGDSLGLQYIKTLEVQGADRGETLKGFVSTNVKVSIPGVRSKGMSVLVLDQDYLKLKNLLGEKVQGILGYELFRRFVVRVDYNKNMVTFYEPDYFRAESGHKGIPLHIEDTKPFIYAEVTLKNGTIVTAPFLMDTGASHAILLEMGASAAIVPPQKRLVGTLGRSLGGDLMGFYGRVEQVRFNKFKFNDVIASFNPPDNVSEAMEMPDRGGSIGGEILSRFTVTFDYLGGMVYFRKEGNYRWPFEFNMSGMELMAVGQNLDTFVVNAVRANSPADGAGIERGDTVLGINSLRPGTDTLNNAFKLLRKKDGKRIRLKMLQNGAVLRKEIRLKRQI